MPIAIDAETKKGPSKNALRKQRNKKRKQEERANLEAFEKDKLDTIAFYNMYGQHIPIYDERILVDFLQKEFSNYEIEHDITVIAGKQKNIFYHCYAPILDIFIHKYGKEEPYKNEKTGYTSKGFITWRHMRNIPCKFKTGYSNADSRRCYHRGYEPTHITLSKEQEEALYNEESYKEIELNLTTENIYNDTKFKENDFFIKITDIKNNAKLILIK